MRVLYCHQLLPPSLLEECAPRTWFYVDMTLRQVFGSRYENRSLGDVATRAVELERVGYHAAPAVITRSHWAAASVIADYGVDAAKVHVVLPGANLDHAMYESWASVEVHRRRLQNGTGQSPVRFVYVGYDWRRKGLDRLLRAHALARARGSTAVVRVIGCDRRSLPAELRDVAGVEWCGTIDKRNDAATFVRLVAESDVGCLLSHEEAAGISLREFGALGLAVLATTAGGAAENARGETAVLVDPTESDEVLSDYLIRLAADRAWRESLRAASWERREECSWAAAVERLSTIINSSPSRSAAATSAPVAGSYGGIGNRGA